MILSAQSIRKRGAHVTTRPGMVQPFHERTEAHGMTFGLSAAGYDVRIAERVCIEPGGFMLASTIERFDMPRDVLAMVADKSTWARRGVCVQHTVIEPGWRGVLTLELTNHGKQGVDIEAGMPIAQIVFHLLDAPTEQPYAGRYQDQEPGPQAARLGADAPHLVPPHKMGETIRCGGLRSGDEDSVLTIDNKRVGYLEWSGDLYAIGKDGNAQWIANVNDTFEAVTQLRNWRKLHV